VEADQLRLNETSVRVLGVIAGFVEECVAVSVLEKNFRDQCFVLVAGVAEEDPCVQQLDRV